MGIISDKVEIKQEPEEIAACIDAFCAEAEKDEALLKEKKEL